MGGRGGVRESVIEIVETVDSCNELACSSWIVVTVSLEERIKKRIMEVAERRKYRGSCQHQNHDRGMLVKSGAPPILFPIVR